MGRPEDCVTLVVTGFGIFAMTGDGPLFPLVGERHLIGPMAEDEPHLATTLATKMVAFAWFVESRVSEHG